MTTFIRGNIIIIIESRFLSDFCVVVVGMMVEQNVPVPSRPRRFRDGRVDDLPRALERVSFPLVLSPPFPIPHPDDDAPFVFFFFFFRRRRGGGGRF